MKSLSTTWIGISVLLFLSLSALSTASHGKGVEGGSEKINGRMIDNDERLLQSLIERGVICQGLTYAQQQESLRLYLNKMAQFDRKKKRKDQTDVPPAGGMIPCIKPES